MLVLTLSIIDCFPENSEMLFAYLILKLNSIRVSENRSTMYLFQQKQKTNVGKHK